MDHNQNPNKPWMDRNTESMPKLQHPLPKNPKKWLTKFNPDTKKPVDDHINRFMLRMRLRNVEHEYIVCKVFPDTFERKDYTSYFTQPTSSITSWDQF